VPGLLRHLGLGGQGAALRGDEITRWGRPATAPDAISAMSYVIADSVYVERADRHRSCKRRDLQRSTPEMWRSRALVCHGDSTSSAAPTDSPSADGGFNEHRRCTRPSAPLAAVAAPGRRTVPQAEQRTYGTYRDHSADLDDPDVPLGHVARTRVQSSAELHRNAIRAAPVTTSRSIPASAPPGSASLLLRG
jgi:hypothetical protein